MVGTALLRRLSQTPLEVLTTQRQSLDLRRQDLVEQWLARNRVDAVFLLAATVGGIEANRSRPAEFLYDNLIIAANVIHAAAQANVAKLMFLGSGCFYPKRASSPIQEASLLTGPIEETNEWYAIAKIAGVKLCQAYRRQFGKDFIVVVPTNLYGPGDNFSLEGSHVIPALIRKIHDAKLAGADAVEIWGTGNAVREFLYVQDAADALVFLMENYSSEEIINVAGGQEISIRELAKVIGETLEYRGGFQFNTNRPDGMPHKVLDASRLRSMGWRPSTDFRQGISETYRAFLTGPNLRLEC
jgi:GDP-L-fucose synthase